MYEKDKILNSFPPDLAKDVRRVLDMLVMKNDDISSRYYIVNLGGLNIAIPERVYMREQTPSNMTAIQRNILDCIFTRHNNGFVRQHHLQNLISCTEYWTIPFCFKLLGEYVDNILYDVKKHLECNMDRYLRFIGENEKFFDRTKNQMISYWNCYYRSRYPALVRYAVGGVLCAAVRLGFIPSPAPQNGFDKVHTVKAEGVRGRRHNHRGTSCRHVVGVVLDIPRLVCVGQRRTKAPHDIQGLVVLGNINDLGDQFT